MRNPSILPLALLLVAGITTHLTSSAPHGPAVTPAIAADGAAPAGPEHTWLAGDAGTWDIQASIWLPGRSDPMKAAGVSTMTMLWNRYLREEFQVGEGDQAMRGIGLQGFNTETRVFQSVYCLNTGSAISLSEGTRSRIGDTLTLTGSAGGMKRRVVIHRVSRDQRRVTYYLSPDGAPEVKRFEMTYTRRK